MKESKKFEKMLEDHRKMLYLDCKQGLKKLGTTLEMLQWKEAKGVTDKGFEELLGIVNDEDTTSMDTTTLGEWHRDPRDQHGFPNRDVGLKLIRFESPG